MPQPTPESDRIYENNPGNIKTLYYPKGLDGPVRVLSDTQFAGALDKGYGKLHPKDNTRKGMFSHPVLGLRALFRDIDTKSKKEFIKNIKNKDDRIDTIIKLYAPSGAENPNQTNYVNFVTEYVNDNPELDEHRAIVEGIIAFENDGPDENRYTQEMIDEAEVLSTIDFKREVDIETARYTALVAKELSNNSFINP
tara:strand:+ start:168 stop:755 length:588 start_codon:yes stop_codon:yes gene_type:complete